MKVIQNPLWPPFMGPRCIVPTQWISANEAVIYQADPGRIWVGLQAWSKLFDAGLVLWVWDTIT